jgi:predicted patatin/cPLA2 family phospholipase
MCEGYHNRLSAKSDRHKQSLWFMIRVLKDEERYIRMTLRRADMGVPPPKRKLKYRRLERSIKRLKRQYRHGRKSLEDYWQAVTHLMVHYH